jgi:hypothetical protein
MVIYGREDLVSTLVRSAAPLMLLTGDSGIGKSTVLAAAQQTAEDALAPPPVRVLHSGGALQQALLQALSDAVSLYVNEQGRAREIAGHLIALANRLASEGASELAKVVVKELLALVRGRIGDDVGKAFAEFLEKLKSTVDESLTLRLTAAVDRGVAQLILDFAAEVCSFVGDRWVRLALDAGERLRDDDIRLLADVSERLPDRLQLLIAFSTYAGHRLQVEFLLGAGTHVVEYQIPGLDNESIAQWLVDEELDPNDAAEVARVTGGYGLHLGDLIKHLKDGGSIEDAPLSEAFARRTNEALQALPLEVARHARALCVFTDPLPRGRLLAFLQVDSATWGEVEDRLSRTRVFSIEVNGRRWFHEQRRQYLLRDVLGRDERAEASARAARELHDLVDREGAVERLGELAMVVADAVPLLQADNQLAAAVTLDGDELALAASLIELIERASSVSAVGGDELLDYARSTFGATGNLIEALRRLKQHDLILVREDPNVAVVVPRWRSGLVVATVAGRAVQELGRLPVPAAASAVFKLEVQPRLGPFSEGHYGLGHPSMAKLSEMAMELRQPSSSSVVAARRGSESNLLVRGSYGGRDFYAAVMFSSASDRDAARGRLEGLDGEVLGQRFDITDLMSHPVGPVPSRRFLTAAERLLERSLGSPVTSALSSFNLDQPLAREEALRRKAAVLRVVRECSTELERMAMQLDEPIGYIYFDDEESFIEAEIRGGREGVQRLRERPDVPWNDPYRFFRRAQVANLRPGEHVAHTDAHYGKGFAYRDPVIDVLGRFHLHAAQFNRYQGQRRKVFLDADWLEQALTEAARRNLEDSRALANAAPLGNRMFPPEPRTTYLLIQLDPPKAGWIPGAFSHATSVVVPNPQGQEEVRVTVVHRQDAEHPEEDHAARMTWYQELGLQGATGPPSGLQCTPP